MPPEEIEIVPFICEIATWLIFGAGIACGLVLVFLANLRKQGEPLLPALGTLQARPFTFRHAVPVVALTGLGALTGALQAPAAEDAAATPKAIIIGMSALSGFGFLIIALCTLLTGRGPRTVFGNPAGTWLGAVGKGLLYGLAALPVVLLVQLAVAAAGNALGLDMASQEIFTWLDDPAQPTPVFAAVVFFAVVVAPVSEELLFRGILLPSLAKGRRFGFAVLLNSFYFALIHLHGPSFLPLMLLSALFSVAYAVTGSILTPIIMHAVFNGTVVLFFFTSK
ncbi:MAG: CPBP family intramembrane metalloprotease [Kiritimatiellaeota bacterium]|nr:CPBP family intramembrane metalloprotease [Kiritimatiellota bacterium]